MSIRRLLQIARKLTGHPERLGDRIAALDASFVTSGSDRKEKIRPVNLGDRRRIRLCGAIHAANSITGKRAVRQENTANEPSQLQRDAWQYRCAVLPPCTADGSIWQYTGSTGCIAALAILRRSTSLPWLPFALVFGFVL